MEAFARVRPASVPSLAKALGPTSLAVPPGLPRRRGFSRLLDNDLTLVVKISDTSQQWQCGFESRLRSIVPWNRPREGRCVAGCERFARRAPRFDGELRYRPFPSSLNVRARRAAPTCSPVAKRICCIGAQGRRFESFRRGQSFRSSAVEHATPERGKAGLECSPAIPVIRGEEVGYFAPPEVGARLRPRAHGAPDRVTFTRASASRPRPFPDRYPSPALREKVARSAG